MIRLLPIVIGYLLGSFQTAYFYGKIKGIDIREHGSGNAGTTNTLRVLGPKAGLVVFVGDLIKCIIAVTLTRFLISPNYPEIGPLLMIYAGAGAIIGHNYPFYLKFKGGKGIACTGGLMLSFHWIFIPVGLITFFGTFFITHYVSLGSLLLYVVFPVELIISGQLGLYHVSQAVLNEMYIVVFLLTILAYVKHAGNIKRLLTHTERKTYLTKKNKVD
ncbi:MAG: glycerol-3-phosphate 1-O-acyltransferase PlsY [Lachnospiraceae bacterium]|nr:glycerol-3-phosphate 1-O-acyltransferase PlsY [Lachnospiraceae bacterium]